MSVEATAHTRCIARRVRPRGFTLVELLVVLVILGLIAALAAPQVIRFIAGAKSDTALLQIQRLSTALDLYRLEVGSYPSDQDALIALVERPLSADGWNGPYLKNTEALIDPWRRLTFGAYILSLTDRFAGCRGPVLVAMRSPKSGFSGHGPLCYVRTD